MLWGIYMQLNLEQKRLIQAKPAGHGLIKGVAGSGKTTVAVNRIPFLLNHYCFADNDAILMVTYNKTLVNYITYVYNKVEQEEQMSFDSLLKADSSKIEIYTIDSLMYKYYLKYKKVNKVKIDVISDNNLRYKIMAQCVAEMEKQYADVNIIDQRNIKFLIDEIDWIKSCNYMELEEYQGTERLGRMSSTKGEGPQKLAKNSNKRRAIFELMNLYNKRLGEEGYIEFKDMALLALKQANSKPEKKYTHILIDESQDLSRVQIEFLKALYNEKEYSSIIFVADTAQSIYTHSWLVKGRSFTSIGFDMTGKSFTLCKNYRTTTQIAQAAYSLLEKDENITEDENYVKPSLIDRQGTFPVYRYFKSVGEEAAYVIKEIKENLIQECPYSDIVIIAKNKNQLKEFKDILDKNNIPSSVMDKKDENFDVNSIKLLTMHSIKGLEFKVVFIIGLNEGIIPYSGYKSTEDEDVQESMERKLLYVGMTRANELLYMCSSGKPSKFISEINPKYLRLNTTSRISKYYNIPIDNYRFKDKIVDLYSNEEKIRQWFLEELISSYHYPQSLIDVEYRINCFSKPGFIDAAISIYNSNKKIPYILIETKSFGRNVADGIEQMKSYMANVATSRYGVITNGNDIIVLDKEYEIVDDIPEFNTAMLPSSIENLTYVDMIHNKKFMITKNLNNPRQLTLMDIDGQSDFEEGQLTSLKVYSEIAAGQPIFMNSECTSEYYLPKEFFRGKENCFILKVRGDSMIGAEIDNGDYVVIEPCSTADNRDIVAVATDSENATLKRYMKMGDSILLIPENEKYEPIQIKSDQAKIMGKAIGVIKKEV